MEGRAPPAYGEFFYTPSTLSLFAEVFALCIALQELQEQQVRVSIPRVVIFQVPSVLEASCLLHRDGLCGESCSRDEGGAQGTS